MLALGLVFVPIGLAIFSSFPLCPLASFFGLPCPGCGLTRATLAVMHGDFVGAYHFHPLVFVILPLYAVAVGSLVVNYLFGISTPVAGPAAPPGTAKSQARNQRAERYVSWVGAICLAALLGVWVARFAGYLGGPVPVESLADWGSRFSRSSDERDSRLPAEHPARAQD